MYQFNNMKNLQSGQTIIEAIVALMTILLIITAIAIVIVNGLYNSQFIKNQNQANKYAQQGIEFIRNIQRNDLRSFKDLDPNGIYCIDETTNALIGNCFTAGKNTGTSFNRTIIFTPNDAKCPSTQVKVTVNVKWVSTKCPGSNTYCHEVKLVACMQYEIPASNP